MHLKKKNSIRCRFRKYKNPRDKLEFKLLNKRCKTLAQESYKSYINRAEDNISKQNQKR